MKWIQNRWSGFGIGYDNGLWDGSFGQTLKLSIPFGRRLGRFFGARIRGGVVHYTNFPDGGDRYDPVINVGGELFGRTPVWWGVLRVYGGEVHLRRSARRSLRPPPTTLASAWAVTLASRLSLRPS